jgi:DNA (cytosine-5)-methyltransferase 1
MNSASLRAIDLFAGAGGLSQGLKRAGFGVVAAIEFDDVAAATYRKNYPETLMLESDITQVSVTTLRRQLQLSRGELDLLAGCPPCQGFSTMRTLNGRKIIRDSRNDLIFEFLRFVDEFHPKALMLENVPGLATDRRLNVFVDAITDLGYACESRVVDAAEYGVPQRRRRMILLASRVCPVRFPEPHRKRKTVFDAIGALAPPGHTGDALHDAPEQRAAHVLDLIRHIPHDGGSRRDAPRRFALKCHQRFDGFHDVYGRMSWNDVSPTITSGCNNPSKGRFLHPEQDRAISLREAALLQTFPRRYFFSLARGKEHAALLIGNALPPRLIAAVARPLARAIRATSREMRHRAPARVPIRV